MSTTAPTAADYLTPAPHRVVDSRLRRTSTRSSSSTWGAGQNRSPRSFAVGTRGGGRITPASARTGSAKICCDDFTAADPCKGSVCSTSDAAQAAVFTDESFDVIALIGVLEHMLQPEREICAREFCRVLKPGGELFVFDTPNRLHPFDHHTTHLWLVGWMPVALARRWAILRGRFATGVEFARLGATGISRRQIDWTVSHATSFIKR